MKSLEVTIMFEGVQGSGKTTFLRIVAEAIEAAGHYLTAYEPGSNQLKATLYHSPLPKKTRKEI